MPTRIVIIGASGNIGTALLRRLAAAEGEYEIHGVARRRPPPIGVYESVTWHQLDVAEHLAATRLQRVFTGADSVVHLAWAFQPTRNTRYLDAVGVNGSSAVLNAARAAGVGQLVHMSSVGTYAAGRYGQRVDESWSTAGIPSSPYSRAKSAVEAILDDYERNNERRHGHHPNAAGVRAATRRRLRTAPVHASRLHRPGLAAPDSRSFRWTGR